MEPRHSRQNSLANQEYPAPATVTYQDSGYSTGPSPSVRRRRRALDGVAAGARPGSLGSSGELSVVSERLMAKRDSRVSLETQLSEGSTPRSSLQALARPGGPRDDRTSSSHSLTPSASNHGDSALSTLAVDGEGCYKATYGKKMSLDASIQSSAENPCQVSCVCVFVCLFVCCHSSRLKEMFYIRDPPHPPSCCCRNNAASSFLLQNQNIPLERHSP